MLDLSVYYVLHWILFYVLVTDTSVHLKKGKLVFHSSKSFISCCSAGKTLCLLTAHSQKCGRDFFPHFLFQLVYRFTQSKLSELNHSQ